MSLIYYYNLKVLFQIPKLLKNFIYIDDNKVKYKLIKLNIKYSLY